MKIPYFGSCLKFQFYSKCSVLSFEFADNYLTEGAALSLLFHLDFKIYLDCI